MVAPHMKKNPEILNSLRLYTDNNVHYSSEGLKNVSAGRDEGDRHILLRKMSQSPDFAK